MEHINQIGSIITELKSHSQESDLSVSESRSKLKQFQQSRNDAQAAYDACVDDLLNTNQNLENEVARLKAENMQLEMQHEQDRQQIHNQQLDIITLKNMNEALQQTIDKIAYTPSSDQQVVLLQSELNTAKDTIEEQKEEIYELKQRVKQLELPTEQEITFADLCYEDKITAEEQSRLFRVLSYWAEKNKPTEIAIRLHKACYSLHILKRLPTEKQIEHLFPKVKAGSVRRIISKVSHQSSSDKYQQLNVFQIVA